jgi:hypothetical protein
VIVPMGALLADVVATEGVVIVVVMDSLLFFAVRLRWR